jgi:F420 biosynthesis protein FbiB-like protein
LHEFLRTRRSVRRLSSGSISQDTVDKILASATFAPSAHNRQPWRFAIACTSEGRARLADEMATAFRRDLETDGLSTVQVDSRVVRSKNRILTAPLAIVLCMDASDMDAYPDELRARAEREMAIQSTANAGATLLLAAHAEGLGASWSCAPLFAPEVVSSALGLPATWEPQALFLIGRPEESPAARERRPVNEISLYV